MYNIIVAPASVISVHIKTSIYRHPLVHCLSCISSLNKVTKQTNTLLEIFLARFFLATTPSKCGTFMSCLWDSGNKYLSFVQWFCAFFVGGGVILDLGMVKPGFHCSVEAVLEISRVTVSLVLNNHFCIFHAGTAYQKKSHTFCFPYSWLKLYCRISPNKRARRGSRKWALILVRFQWHLLHELMNTLTVSAENLIQIDIIHVVVSEIWPSKKSGGGGVGWCVYSARYSTSSPVNIVHVIWHYFHWMIKCVRYDDIGVRVFVNLGNFSSNLLRWRLSDKTCLETNFIHLVVCRNSRLCFQSGSLCFQRQTGNEVKSYFL